MKGNTSSGLFKISFAPYILLIIYSIYSSIIGISAGFFGSSKLYYGFEGYSTAFIFTIYLFWYIFAACLVIQFGTLIYEKIRYKSKVWKCILSMIGIYLAGCIWLFFE